MAQVIRSSYTSYLFPKGVLVFNLIDSVKIVIPMQYWLSKCSPETYEYSVVHSIFSLISVLFSSD